MKVNTLLNVDLKTRLRNDALPKPGKNYHGILHRDTKGTQGHYDDSHYTFVETCAPAPVKRNPHVYIGQYITITRRDDGSLRPNFRPMRVCRDFCTIKYAIGVARELATALKSLIDEADS